MILKWLTIKDWDWKMSGADWNYYTPAGTSWIPQKHPGNFIINLQLQV